MSGFEFKNVKSTALIDVYRKSCAKKAGSKFHKFLQADGSYTVVCEVPLVVTPPPSTSSSARLINIDDDGLDALARVAQSEVGHFKKYGNAQLSGGLAAVVDTILNRVAHDKYPDDIEAVVDQPWQFSAVKLKAGGTWRGLDEARAQIMDIVREHVAGRANGVGSAIEGATHFLNPYYSSATALASWGNYVKANAVAVYGNDSKKDVHYHGFAPGASLPDEHTIAFDGNASTFSGDGKLKNTKVKVAMLSGSSLRDEIVRICLAEHAYFDNGKAKEDDDPQYKRVGQYWKSVGQSYTGKDKKRYWSAAFISWVLEQAGAGARFPGAAGHCVYFQHFVSSSDPMALYEPLPQAVAVPEPGDIVHYGRESAKRYDFTEAAADFGADGWYPSHSDIVVEKRAGELITLGGNVGDTVGKKSVPIDANGLLVDRQEKGQTYPWIGVLKLKL